MDHTGFSQANMAPAGFFAVHFPSTYHTANQHCFLAITVHTHTLFRKASGKHKKDGNMCKQVEKQSRRFGGEGPMKLSLGLK